MPSTRPTVFCRAGRVVFLLDEVARLGYMSSLARARDAGRKYGITLVMLYQSEGQLREQWGEGGKSAWFESASWRSYAAIGSLEQARAVSEALGEHGVVLSSETRTAAKAQDRWRSAPHPPAPPNSVRNAAGALPPSPRFWPTPAPTSSLCLCRAASRCAAVAPSISDARKWSHVWPKTVLRHTGTRVIG